MSAKRKAKPEPERMYTLTVSETQACTIMAACELAARIGMCQLDVVADAIPNPDKSFNNLSDLRDAMRDAERVVKPIIGLPGGGYYGIHHDAVTPYAKRAWDIYSLIRHRISWDAAVARGTVKEGEARKWPEMMTVNYDEPTNIVGERMARIAPATTAPE